jgi:hypothetical protein
MGGSAPMALTKADQLAYEEVMREVEHYEFDLFAASLDDQYRQMYEHDN